MVLSEAIRDSEEYARHELGASPNTLKSYSGRQRVRSWSSILSSTFPPNLRAVSHTHNAFTTCPRCRYPVGLGANRVTNPGSILTPRPPRVPAPGPARG